jgi:hypothetical protein
VLEYFDAYLVDLTHGHKRAVAVDPIGVSERGKSDSRPLKQKKSVPLNKLLEDIALGMRESSVLSSLADRLIGMEKRIAPELLEDLEKLAGGKRLSQIAQDLLNAIDPDYIEGKAKEGKSGNYQPGEQELLNLRVSLANSAVAPIATRSGSRLTLSLIRRSCFSESSNWRNSRRSLKAHEIGRKLFQQLIVRPLAAPRSLGSSAQVQPPAHGGRS